MYNKKIVYSLILLFVLGATSLVYGKRSQVKAVYIEPQYAADFSDDRILVGASHNIFIGKVVRQIGVKDRGIGLETQFEVEVIDNIKGELNGIVNVDQQGGYKDGTLYVIRSDIDSKKNESVLLQPGSTYLLTTRYSSKENWYTINSYPSATELISTNVEDTKELKSMADNDVRVQALKTAYKNEILLEADIKNNKILNSYKSLQAKMM